MFIVQVYPHSDSAMPFKLNFNTKNELGGYLAKMIDRPFDVIVTELPNEVYRELD